FGEEGVGILALLLAAHETVAKDVLFGEQLELLAGEAFLERQDQRYRLAGRGKALRFLPRFGELQRALAGIAEQRGKPGAAAGGIGGDQRLDPACAERREILRRRLVNVGVLRALG